MSSNTNKENETTTTTTAAASGGGDDDQQLDAAALKAKMKKEAREAAAREKQAKYEAKVAAQAAKASDAKKKEEKKKVVATTEDEVYVNITPDGGKKDLTHPFAKQYNPTAVEAAWYSWWQKQGYFQPKLTSDGKTLPAGTFVISIPPPNVTGYLHIGHALTNSIQDALVRWNRMLGKSTLYVPGCDHAGIATQVVVEKKLMREMGITRHDVGREKFVEQVWKWKDQHGDGIYNQIKRLGTSVDWSRVAFTMDPGPSEAVREAFVRLHDDGTIYRANRLVNWCTKLKTALSNLEVEPWEIEGRTFRAVPDHDPKKKYEFGVIVSFAYKIENSDEEIVVATTRVETMLGDTAVAVHPSDERYKHLIGKNIIHPFNGRKIPIVADEYVDKEFGTGAVKITPAHDPNDYAIGKRHNLEFINIFTDDGKVNENGAPYTGLQRFDARVAVLKDLKELGLYKDTKDNKMSIPICTRSGNIVEMLMKPQWWVDCKDMAGKAMDAVRNKEIEIIPEASEKEWFSWLSNIQDWCISRQLWWGHRVPAYYVKIAGEDTDNMDPQYWVSGRTAEEALMKAQTRFPNIEKSKITLEQDPDVLDTWFSSGLWPFSILGWPKQTNDMENFYPNALLETGNDILFFWVARMVMMGIKLTGKVPFTQVFCHPTVRDPHGRKMSKSLGNVIDPIDVIEGISLERLQKRLDEGNLDPSEVTIAKAGQAKDYPNGIGQCGTDALRFALLNYTGAGRTMNIDIARVEGYRKFCNKLWNAIKLALQKLGDDFVPNPETIRKGGNESLADFWILNKLNIAITEVNANLEQRNFMQATSAIYNFWLYELCDVYLELCKPVIDGSDVAAKRAAQDTLYTCIDYGLKMLHPMMPFVTEELWQRIPRRRGDTTESIMISQFPIPRPEWTNSQAESEFEQVNKVIRAARSLLADYNILKDATLYIQSTNPSVSKVLKANVPLCITALIKAIRAHSFLESGDEIPAGCAVFAVSEECNVYLLVKGNVDIDGEIAKLEVKKQKAAKELADLMVKVNAADYEKKVKPEVRESNASKIKKMENEIETFQTSIANFNSLK